MRKPVLHNENQRGQAIVLIAAVMVVLIGSLGLAIDGGGLFLMDRDIQNATDAAGLSAAYALCTEQNAETIGKASALENGFIDGENNATVIVENPPIPAVLDMTDTFEASINGDEDYVVVIISAIKPSYFIQMLYPYPLAISAKTIARCRPSVNGGWPPNAAMISMFSGNCPDNGFKTAGGAKIIIHGDLYLNQEDTPGTPCSLKSSGTNELYVDGKICTQGRFDDAGRDESSIFTNPSRTVQTPVETDCNDVEPITNPDPLALIPAYGGQPPTCPPTPNRGSLDNFQGGIAPPGTYTNFVMSGPGTVTLATGTYCVQGDIKTGNNQSIISEPLGVTIYQDCASCAFDMTGGTVDIAAKQTGEFAGLLFVSRGDVNATPGGGEHVWNGGGRLDMTGTIYSPMGNCSVLGGSDTELVAQFICQELTAGGGTLLEIWYLPGAFYNRPPAFGLVE